MISTTLSPVPATGPATTIPLLDPELIRRYAIPGPRYTSYPAATQFTPAFDSATVEVVLIADTLDARDMVCDFKALKHIIETAVARYDHSLALNTADPQFAAHLGRPHRAL